MNAVAALKILKYDSRTLYNGGRIGSVITSLHNSVPGLFELGTPEVERALSWAEALGRALAARLVDSARGDGTLQAVAVECEGVIILISPPRKVEGPGIIEVREASDVVRILLRLGFENMAKSAPEGADDRLAALRKRWIDEEAMVLAKAEEAKRLEQCKVPPKIEAKPEQVGHTRFEQEQDVLSWRPTRCVHCGSPLTFLSWFFWGERCFQCVLRNM